MNIFEITSDGNAVDIEIGFVPNRLTITNKTSLAQLVWVDTLTDGEAYKQVAAGTRTLEGTLGITPILDDSDSLLSGTATPFSQGVNLGAMVDINDTNGEVLEIVAERREA